MGAEGGLDVGDVVNRGYFLLVLVAVDLGGRGGGYSGLHDLGGVEGGYSGLHDLGGSGGGVQWVAVMSGTRMVCSKNAVRLTVKVPALPPACEQ